jgi:branched-chain amino acid transport system permease protein
MDTGQSIVNLLLNGVAQGCVYGLVALGFVLIYKATEVVNLAQGELMMLGAFAGYTLIGLWGLPYWLGLGLSAAVMMAFGYGLERVVFRPMVGQPPFAIMILSIGVGLLLRAVAGMIWGHQPVNFQTPFDGDRMLIFGTQIWAQQVVVIATTLLLCILVSAFFRHTRLGMVIRAASQNRLAACYVGIPIHRVSAIAWGLGAALAGVAGVLLAPLTLIDPHMGLVGLKAFAAAVLGGFGSLPGAVAGGLLVGLVEQFAAFYLPSGFDTATAYVLLLGMLLIHPQGLFRQLQPNRG